MKQPGFTLIELMVTVAIIGILAMIAIPSYSAYLTRSRLNEAKVTLGTTAVRLENYYQDHRDYGSTTTTCGVTVPAAAADFFTYSCVAGATASNQSFLLTATGKPRMAGYVYTLNEQNLRRTTSFAGATVSLDCWISKAGETC